MTHSPPQPQPYYGPGAPQPPPSYYGPEVPPPPGSYYAPGGAQQQPMYADGTPMYYQQPQQRVVYVENKQDNKKNEECWLIGLFPAVLCCCCMPGCLMPGCLMPGFLMPDMDF